MGQKLKYQCKLIPVISLGLVLLLTACEQKATSQPAPTTPPPAAIRIPVKTGLPISRMLINWDEYTGRIEAVQSVEIRARVSGYLVRVNFRDGEVVKKGDLLFTIDPRPYLADLKRLEAQLDGARTRLERSTNDVRRAEKLWASKAISEEDWDGRGKSAQEAWSTVKSAEAAVENARLNLDYTKVRSPINGKISRQLITEGNLVTGDQTLLTTVVSEDPVYVYVDADERAVLRYRRLTAKKGRQSGPINIPAQLELQDETGYPHEGFIDYFEPKLDSATGTLRTRGVFRNPAGLLSPGLFARVRINSGIQEKTLLIQDRAIVTDQGEKFIWLAKPDDGVEYRKVVTGSQQGPLRVIREGLNPDDKVVIEGIQKLKPGVKIKAEPAVMSDKQ